MANKPLPSQEVLRQLLDYDPATGVLTWRERGPEWFTDGTRQSAADFASRWNSAYAGKPALNTANSGYFTGTLLRKRALAHRVIWKLTCGHEPNEIDHINGNPFDNRKKNLRNVSHEQNMRNTRRRADNKSGIPGVEKFKKSRWVAKIGNRHIGIFHCLGQAIKARKAAERQHGFHENHGRAA